MSSPHEPGPQERKRLLALTAELVQQHTEQAASLPVSRSVTPEEVRGALSRYDFEEPTEAAAVLDHVATLLRDWTVHTTSPRYFGLFNPAPAFMGVLGDMLAAAFNPQLAVWTHAPAAVEIEQHVVRFLAERVGYPTQTASGTFATGGAEANLTAVLAALTRTFPAYADEGLGVVPGRPVLYASADAHLAWVKIAHATGLGRTAVRLVKVGPDQRLDVAELRRMITADRERALLPFLVAATAGTTSGGIIDPLTAVADVCSQEALWFHVDAAWAGAAVLSDALRPYLDGIQDSDSVTVDAHKWLSAPMGAGMFLTRHDDVLGDAFRVATAYMPAATPAAADPYSTSIQWSRRFSGLKVFLSLAAAGRHGHAAQLEADVELSGELRRLLSEHGWVIENPGTPFPVVCTTHRSWSSLEPDSRARVVADVVARANATGRVWVSATRSAGRPAVRACITSYRTTRDDLRVLVDELESARALVASPPRPGPGTDDGPRTGTP